MTHRFTTMILTAGLSALLAGLTLSAQINRSEVATIPFAFEAQGQWHPAGTYRVQQRNESGLFQLYSVEGESTFLNAPVENTGAAESPKLVFRCYGNERVLATIWMENRTRYSTRESSREKEMRRSLGMSSLIS